MTSFSSAEHYQPFFVLLIGSLTFIGFLGTGIGILRFLRFKLNSPWLQVIGVLFGIQIFSLLIQLIGMAQAASHLLLICAWATLVIFGGISNARWNRPSRFAFKKSKSFLDWVPCVFVFITILAMLLVAIAPSTKHDELHYHMLVPSRIVMDGALHFYQFPIVSAILPHMVFQISLAPLHALGFPDAGNVISWWIGLTFLWFCYCMIRSRNDLMSWNWLWIAAISVGLYPAINYVTSGSHAMGDLATVAAVILLLEHENFSKEKNNLTTLAFTFSILCLSGATAKLIFMPLNLIILTIAGVSLLKQTNSFEERKHILLGLCLPWIILIFPLIFWTYLKSGSPFGPVMGRFLPNSVYDPRDITMAFGNLKRFSRPPSFEFIKTIPIFYSPLIFIGTAGVFFVKEIKVRHRLILGSLALFQFFWILLMLPYQLRFFAGLHYAFAVLFAMNSRPAIQKRMTSKIVLSLVCSFLLLPWLVGQLFYAQQFFSVSLGIQKPSEFYKNKVALYSDYQELDRILAKDAALFSSEFYYNINSVYSPRKIYMSSRDVPSGTPLFLLWIFPMKPLVPRGYQLGNLIYENKQACVQIYRRPGLGNDVNPLKVFRLQKIG